MIEYEMGQKTFVIALTKEKKDKNCWVMIRIM